MDIFEDFELIQELEEIEEVDILIREQRTHRTKNRVRNYDLFHKLTDGECVQRFRFCKETIIYILDLIENDLQPPSNRNNPIKPLLQLLVTLRFYATGSFYITVADFGKMHKSTAARIIKKVTTALSRLGHQFIYMPETDEEKSEIMRGFYEIARFPRVLGAIDGTHIRIFQSPGGQDGELFRNRKGYFSLNVQVVADANNYIRDIVAHWSGSAHDSNIFDNSRVRMTFEHGEMDDGLLLGDSGYPLRSYIMTPFANPNTEAENLFNESQIRSRNVVETTFGIWKRRFPILSIGMRCNIQLIQNIIIATAVLHNVARSRNEEPLDDNEDYDRGDLDNREPAGENDNVRRSLVDYFQTLL